MRFLPQRRRCGYSAVPLCGVRRWCDVLELFAGSARRALRYAAAVSAGLCEYLPCSAVVLVVPVVRGPEALWFLIGSL